MKRRLRILAVAVLLLQGCFDANDPAGPDLFVGEPLSNIVAPEVSGSFGFLPPDGRWHRHRFLTCVGRVVVSKLQA